MTKVFAADISKLNFDLTNYTGFLSAYRMEKTKRLKSEKDKKLSVLAEIMLARFLGRKPNYNIDKNGKPCGEEIEFNFSHSGDYAVCAVSDLPVGVDIEKIRPVNLEIAKKFCKSEYENILNSKNPNDTFFEYWVKKESYLKACGMGIKAGLGNFNTDKMSEFIMYDKIKGYKLCVCSKEYADFEVLSEL